MGLYNMYFVKLRRSRTVFLCLLVVLVFYIVVNQLVINWFLSSSDQSAEKFDELQINQKQINVIHERIDQLSNAIDKSKKDVNQINVLINQANLELLPSATLTPAIKNPNDLPKITHKTKIAVLVFSCNRPEAIRNHLDQLFAIRQVSVDAEKFPIIVSQDCGDSETEKAILSYKDKLYDFIKQPDLSDITTDEKSNIIPKHMRGYYKIARHYKWALDQVFTRHRFETVIMNEDDLNLSPDFLSYFEAMHKILLADKTLFCVSAWNDNGKSTLINPKNIESVYRTDFFPGLGWMMQQSLWREFREKWPNGFWDDWIREPVQRQDRSCLRPEIPRTEMSKNEAQKGVSQGQFLDKFLKLISMNRQTVDWSSIDNKYLLQQNYDAKFYEDVYANAYEIPFVDYLKNNSTSKHSKVLITYESKEEFVKYAKYFGIMEDFKAGVPRTAYKGVCHFYFHDQTVYIAPKQKKLWSGYPVGW